MGISQLGYIGIGVSDIKGWEQFATGVLGLEVSERATDGSLYLRMDEHHHRLALYPTGEDDVTCIGWELSEAGSLESLIPKLQAAGVEVKRGTKEDRERRKVCDLIRFEDPNGIPLELFYGPLVVDRPFQPSRPIAGFKAGPLGLGHVVLASRDFEGSISFYTDILGLRISDYVHGDRPGVGHVTLVFFHCNPRHHSLAFLSSALSPKKISHFMLELNALDDVGSTYYLCQEKKIPITMSLGRHTNDQMLSFYMQSPSGFNVEYGWGARLVEDATWVVQQHTAGSVWGHVRTPA